MNNQSQQNQRTTPENKQITETLPETESQNQQSQNQQSQNQQSQNQQSQNQQSQNQQSQKSQKKRQVDTIILLDSSGSMLNMGDEPVQAVNSFIKEQKNAEDSTFSLYTFNNTVTTVYENVPVNEVEEYKDFDPDNMTALYDAIGNAITKKLKSDRSENVVMVIVTDGLENASREYRMKDIKKLTTDAEENHGWKIIYIGANQDVSEESGKINLTRCASFDQETPGTLSGIMRHTSNTISDFREGANDIDMNHLETDPL